MKEQEKRHGPLNSTCDASLDELSEVCGFLKILKFFNLLFKKVLSFIGSPASRLSSESTVEPVSRRSARKLQLDDDGYDSFNHVSLF